MMLRKARIISMIILAASIVVAAAMADAKVAKAAEGMELVKTILVKNKLVNLIFKPKG